MSRRLLALNVVLAIASVALAAGIVRTVLATRPLPAPSAPRAAGPPQAAATAEPGNAGAESYTVVAARNLFNPARSETAVAAVVVAKPVLHGVVVDGDRSRAFLEEPAARRVAGYSVGDSVGGGKIQKITDDRVVIARPEGPLEILLQDPGKPRAAPAVTTATAVPAQPGPPPSQAPPAPPQVRRRVPAPGQPGND